jgi:hypothetical protein
MQSKNARRGIFMYMIYLQIWLNTQNDIIQTGQQSGIMGEQNGNYLAQKLTSLLNALAAFTLITN